MEHLDHYGHGITTETDAMIGHVFKEGRKIKTFRGETAWMDAERYADDTATNIRYGKE